MLYFVVKVADIVLKNLRVLLPQGLQEKISEGRDVKKFIEKFPVKE